MADLMKRLAKERDTGRMAFLAHKDQIRQALAEGYKVKAIWRALDADGVMPVGYESFLRYVKELPEYGARAKRPRRAPAEPEGPEKPRRVPPAEQSKFSLRRQPGSIQEMMETSK